MKVKKGKTEMKKIFAIIKDFFVASCPFIHYRFENLLRKRFWLGHRSEGKTRQITRSTGNSAFFSSILYYRKSKVTVNNYFEIDFRENICFGVLWAQQSLKRTSVCITALERKLIIEQKRHFETLWKSISFFVKTLKKRFYYIW